MLNKRNLTIFVGTLILGLAVAIGARPARSETIEVQRNRGLRVVQVDTVRPTNATREVRFPGLTRSVQRASLAFTIPARVASRPVEVGDRVRAGQVLASLDSSEYALANRSAEAALAEIDVRLEQARRDETRVEQLAAAKAATAEELEKVRAGSATLVASREAAAARVEDTRRLLRETSIRAPFDGTVTKVKLEAGEWASSGATVVELSGSSRIEVRVDVPESMREGISTESRIAVNFPMSGKSGYGTIASVADAASGAGSLFPVIVTLEPTEGVVAGMTAEVVLSVGTSAELTVPLAAVLDSGSSRASVFRVDDGVAHLIHIEPGRLVGDRLTVSGQGLSAGDSVAVVGHTALVDGDKVEVR